MADFNNKLGDYTADENQDLEALLAAGNITGADQSLSTDLVSAAGLQSLNVDVDAEATISATSTAKSTAEATNVSSDSASLASVEFNSGLQGSNVIGVDSNAGLNGTAGTTVKASAATSEGDALSYAQIEDSAGIKGVTSLTVGGELNALGKAVNTITSSSETVVGKAEAGSNLSGTQFGLEANLIDVSSDASIQGLAQLTNSATASATSGTKALAEAFAKDLTGADLDGLKVGGVASVAGQTSFGNTSKATNVDGKAIAESDLATATGLKASDKPVNNAAAAGIDVSSDATITGLSSITSSATAATTAGLADATSVGGSIQGIQIEDAQIGGIASITGQTNFTGSAKSSNVTDGNSIATSNLAAAGGLDADELVDVSSDATLKGLTSINMSAMAESTGASGDPTDATATFNASNITGADLDAVTIGGVGNLLGQVGFNASASSSNVTGNATSGGVIAQDTYGIESISGLTNVSGLTSDAHTEIKSDGTIKGIASVTSSASAETTDGIATAINLAASLEGAALDSTTIGGVGDLLGQVGFTGTSAATSVSGDANSATGAYIADGLTTAALTDIKSDGTLKGLASINSSASAETTAGTAISEAAGVYVQGASLNTVEIGGVGDVLGQAGITSAAQANSVTGDAFVMPTGGFEADGLVTDGSMTVMSDATLKGIASVTGSATATTTDGVADATAFGATINGADFGDLVDIGGVGSIQGAASFNLSAKSTNVTGESSTATALAFDAVGLESVIGSQFGEDDDYGINIASDASISGTSIGTLKGEAFSTASTTLADVGNVAGLTGANIGDLNVGGVANVTGAAQLTGTGLAQNVGGDSASATANVGLDASVTGLNASLFDVASDATITAQAFGTLNATATSTGGNATATAGNYSTDEVSTTVLTGLASGLEMNIGGVGTLSALAQGAESATATSVNGVAQASAGMDLSGAMNLDFASSSDGSLTGIAKLAATASASSTGAEASANGDFSAIGFSGLAIGTIEGVEDFAGNEGLEDLAGIGGVSTLKGQAQITGTLNAESVSGPALAGVQDMTSTITGMESVVLNGASDGTILGTASGMFNTTASSTLGDASGFSSQNLRGISQLDLNLGGNGTINAIVQDTNFVTAHSVSGNATAVASVDAIGLEGGSINIAGNASIMSNVNVDSKAESHTIGG